MSPSRGILLNIVATCGRSLCAFVCGRFIGWWTGGGWDDRAGDLERGGMKVFVVKSWYGEYELKHGMQAEDGIICSSNMSGEMHMRRRNEVFGSIPHGRGALTGAGNR